MEAGRELERLKSQKRYCGMRGLRTSLGIQRAGRGYNRVIPAESPVRSWLRPGEAEGWLKAVDFKVRLGQVVSYRAWHSVHNATEPHSSDV